LTPFVERVIAVQLPGKFGVLFDGWTAGLVHYVAFFALYVNYAGTQKGHLLALAPLKNEEELDAQQHVDLLKQHWHCTPKQCTMLLCSLQITAIQTGRY
jgi:hypothetical protein